MTVALRLEFLHNDRYIVVDLISMLGGADLVSFGNFSQKFIKCCHEKSTILKQFQHVPIIKMNVLAKFHVEKMIFDEIRGHLLCLLFYRA